MNIKNMKLKKISVIALTLFLIVSSLSLTVGAVHSGGSTLYTAPLRFNFQVDGITAELTPSLLYSSGSHYSIINNETALLSDDSGDVSVTRSRVDINSIFVYNSAIECNYKLSFNTPNSSDQFTLTVTAPEGFYNFQKYTIPKIAVPNGYSAEVRITYDLYKTSLNDNDDVVFREFSYSKSFDALEAIPLLFDYVLVNNVEEKLSNNVFISDYNATITFTPGASSGTIPAGWYKWAMTEPPSEDLYVEGDYVLYDCDANSVYMAYVKEDFTLGYVPLDKIGFYCGDAPVDPANFSIAYETGLIDNKDFIADNPFIIYDYNQDIWYIPDPESVTIDQDGIIVGVTPITVQYIDFRKPVDDAVDASYQYFEWFQNNTEYVVTNPIVTGYASLNGSEWYLKDSVSYSAVQSFWNKYKQEFADGTPEAEEGYYEGVTIPLSYVETDSPNGVSYNTIFMEFQPFVQDELDGSYYNYTFYGDFSSNTVLSRGTNTSGSGYFQATNSFSTIKLTEAPSPLAYEWLRTFCTLTSMNGAVSPMPDIPSTYAFTDGDTSLEIVYCLDSEAVIQAQFSAALSDYYNTAYRRGVANGDGEFSGDYGSWLATAVGGFMSFELFPNFSLGGILGVCVAVGLLMMFLKFFAGG